MEKLERTEQSKFTVAGEIANERLIEAATDPDLYPEGTAFIAADQDDVGYVIAETLKEHRPLAIVYPDGGEIVVIPRGGTMAFFEHLLDRLREPQHNLPSKPSPADYRVEVRGGPHGNQKVSSTPDQRLIKALAHPLRVEMLTVLNERIASPNELSHELDEGLSQVSYHIKVLKDFECVELVKTEPRRGAVEHYYRASDIISEVFGH